LIIITRRKAFTVLGLTLIRSQSLCCSGRAPNNQRFSLALREIKLLGDLRQGDESGGASFEQDGYAGVGRGRWRAHPQGTPGKNNVSCLTGTRLQKVRYPRAARLAGLTESFQRGRPPRALVSPFLSG